MENPDPNAASPLADAITTSADQAAKSAAGAARDRSTQIRKLSDIVSVLENLTRNTETTNTLLRDIAAPSDDSGARISGGPIPKQVAPIAQSTQAPLSSTPAPTAQTTRTPVSRDTAAPLDTSRAGGDLMKSILDRVTKGISDYRSYVSANISAQRQPVAAEDYQIGQMSRRAVDYNQQSLQSYRQRIYDLAQGTGLSQDESRTLTFMSNRFGMGTSGGVGNSSTGPLGSFDQGTQAKAVAEQAFGLGLNRGQYFSTLQTLGESEAVGAAGKAGGQKQDYREFGQTIAETLASGRLFDRMDQVISSIGDLAGQIKLPRRNS
jgi:hypothetical protein